MTDTVESIPNTPTPEPVVSAPVESVQTPVETVEIPTVEPVEAPGEVKEAPKEATTLIAKELDKTEVKPTPEVPVETLVPEEVQEKVEETPVESVEVLAPVYETFKFPEGIEVDPDRLGEFTGILADLEVKSKAGHEFVQEFGQKAVDFHVAELQRAVENLNKTQLESWEKTVTDWREATVADPEIGGNRIQTTLDSANKFIRTHGGTSDQQKEFRDLMETSGLGNNPTMLRLLSAAGRAMSEGTPVPATKPPAVPKSKTGALYGRKR